ncbi:hypothetical protein ACOALZ_00485 [Nocardiopsis algeriensis]|uniref:hypothetical protein n=1 Tax=Nocardiopsis algeriensis TaxID=1478215 RepID=UPI003B4296C9
MVKIESIIQEFYEKEEGWKIQVFVASCAERMVQLFTGVVGADPSRSQDVELVLRCMDLLWSPDSNKPWALVAEEIYLLPELAGDEEPPGLLLYAYNAAAALYYATKYREAGDLESVISCCNHALNSAEFISEQLDDGVDRFIIEVERQKNDIEELCKFKSPDKGEVVGFMRGRGQVVGREILADLLGR